MQTSFFFLGNRGLMVNEFEHRAYGEVFEKGMGVFSQHKKVRWREVWQGMVMRLTRSVQWYYLEHLIVYFLVIRLLAFLLLAYGNKARR